MTVLKPYPSYKPSGVEWLGDIPAGWQCGSLRWFVNISSGDGKSKTFADDDNNIPMYGGGEGILGYTNKSNINHKTITIGRVGSSGFVNFINAPAWITDNALIVENIAFHNQQYLFYLLISMNLNQYAMKNAQPLITGELVKSQICVLPNKSEQTRIAEFLDVECGKIDALIAKSEKMVALLDEKRQAVITHYVTKGTNPTAPLKPSGIDWLGDIPAGWAVKRLKHVKALENNSFVDGPFGSNLKSEHFIDEGEVFVIESNFATTEKINEDKLKTITQKHFETISRSEARESDIIIAKIGAQFGLCSILPKLSKRSVVSGNSLKLTINQNLVVNEFVYFFLKLLKWSGQMELMVNSTAQPALSLGEMNNLVFLLPPKTEQITIVKKIQLETAKIDALKEKIIKQIELLKERKTSLITAAVTGKIDVRNYKAQQEAA